MFPHMPKSPSATQFSGEISNRNIRGLPSTARNRVISPAKMELLAAQRRMSSMNSIPLSTPDHQQTLGIRQRDIAYEHVQEERPKKRSRTIGERVGDAVYNTVIVAGGIGVAAYRYWKGSNDGEEEQHASTSFSPDQRIPGSFNYKEADKDEDYVDIDIERPASGTSTPTRTPRKKVYKVHNRLRNVQSPKSKPKKQPKKDKGSNDRLDSMSAQLSAMIADGQKALSEPAQIDEEDLEDEVVPPSSSFTFTQSLPQSRSDYSIGEGLRAAASLYSK